MIGRAADADRWADAVDRWQYQDTAAPGDDATEALAALVRAYMCRRGVEQMRADADEAARKYAVAGKVAAATGLLQGIARILSGDLDGGDAVFEEAITVGAEAGAPDVLAQLLCERALVAIARDQWSQAEAFTAQARALLRPAGLEDADATVCAVQARVALHRGDVTAARQELVSAQRLRPLLTYTQPHLAVQSRIELARAHLALADLAGARTVMREIDELLAGGPGWEPSSGRPRRFEPGLPKSAVPVSPERRL